MKIRYCSDLHLEFNGEPMKVFEPLKDEILLVAGDTIPTAILRRNDSSARKTKKRFVKFLEEVSGYRMVIFVGGNHEHYMGDINDSKDLFCKVIEPFENMVYLEDGFYVLAPDVILLACTLWTDLNKDNPLAHLTVTEGMNDFSPAGNNERQGVIKNGKRMFTTQDSHLMHQRSLSNLSEMYHYHTYDFEKREPDKKTDVIVMTHHAPSSQSINPDHFSDALDYGYFSELDEWILDRPQITHWIHGHTHHNVDYMIGDCNILSNQRGYGIPNMMDDCFNEFNMELCIEAKDGIQKS